MIKDALRSIKDDFSRSLFYWLTFVLTSFFMFLFFHLSYSDIVGVTLIDSQNTIATVLTVFVIAICMIVIFFANSFYVKKKAQSIAIRLVCGGTYFQIVQYLLFQTGILLLLAIPIGIILACLCMPILNLVLRNYLYSSHFLRIRYDAVVSTTVILLFEVIWCTILNLGYTYRHSIKDLLDDGKIQVKFALPSFFQIPLSVKKWGSVLLFIVPVLLFYVYGSEPKNLLFLSIIGMFGLYMNIDYFVIPQMNTYLQTKWIHQKLKMIYGGMLRSDFMLMKKNIILLVVSAVLILSMLIFSLQNPTEVMLAMISFIVMNVLLSLSIMFCYSMEIVGRRKMMKTIARLGYMKDDQEKMIRYEVIGFYCFVMGVSLIYILNILIILYIHQFLHIYFIFVLFISFVIPLVFSGFVNYRYYMKMISEC